MEVYENHLGGLYFSDEVIPIDDRYCEQCGDFDWHLGHADTWEDVLAMITDEDGWVMYTSDYVESAKRMFEERDE